MASAKIYSNNVGKPATAAVLTTARYRRKKSDDRLMLMKTECTMVQIA